jgi:hypothetical protein
MNTQTAERLDVIEAEPKPDLPLAHQPIREIQAASTTPDNLLAMAMQNGASIEMMERLLALKERHDATEARKAYTEDMALAKKNPPTIVKDKAVGYESKDGTQLVGYRHATLGNVVKEVVSWLAAYRFSHAWKTVQIEGGRVAVTCTLTHAMGHSESVTLDSAKDDSGKKNNIQALGSAITYLQRYTLLAITGLATEEQDDDGNSTGVDAVTAVAAEDIAAKAQDGLLVELAKTTTDAEALAVWKTGSVALHATGCQSAYDDFKAAVVAHRTMLKSKAGAA